MGLLLISILATVVSTPAPESFEQIITRAQQLWDAGDNAAVAELFERAHRDDPRPEYLFGHARAEVAMGHCERAHALLDALEASQPPAAILDASRSVREQCVVEPTEPVGPAEPAEPAEPPATSTALEPDASKPRARHWTRDPVGWSLAGSGLVVGAVGSGLWIGAAHELAHPPPTIDEDAFSAHARRWQGVGRAGVAATSVGITLALVGVIRLAVVARRGR
ncbi:tetratricopeptide repeat protein [Paraliomyxa miuraensis]|uniref:hypothetical protein n=1 Tax=Paraliomyxa miuraensis TaxID=376150 RepID=UPI00225B3E19|nr:hypothetical protein [Paraliomyxa miuraensis]MCX4241654.1 hypothetical protein [Paraliomyxa miuraensis]